MALTTERNTAVRKWLMRYFGTCGVTKPEVTEAIDVTDDWLYDTGAKADGITNRGSFAQYLNANANDFSTKTDMVQKTALFAAVALEDAGLLEVIG